MIIACYKMIEIFFPFFIIQSNRKAWCPISGSYRARKQQREPGKMSKMIMQQAIPGMLAQPVSSLSGMKLHARWSLRASSRNSVRYSPRICDHEFPYSLRSVILHCPHRSTSSWSHGLASAYISTNHFTVQCLADVIPPQSVRRMIVLVGDLGFCLVFQNLQYLFRSVQVLEEKTDKDWHDMHVISVSALQDHSGARVSLGPQDGQEKDRK